MSVLGGTFFSPGEELFEARLWLMECCLVSRLCNQSRNSLQKKTACELRLLSVALLKPLVLSVCQALIRCCIMTFWLRALSMSRASGNRFYQLIVDPKYLPKSTKGWVASLPDGILQIYVFHIISIYEVQYSSFQSHYYTSPPRQPSHQIITSKRA